MLELGARITISEKQKREQFDPEIIEEFKKLGVVFEFGGHTHNSIAGRDLIVASPGVHLDLPVLEEARENHILIISEVELAFRFLHKPIIAVTGTNGKTTTATLIYEMLLAGGKKAALAGNIGTPLITVCDRHLDFIVAEISSYQLEGILSFRPWISILLNITPDHMERHGNMEGYARAKARIFLNQGKTDYLVYNPQDSLVSEIVSHSIAKKIPFSTRDIFFDPSKILLKGSHNMENIMAASLAAELCGVPRDSVKKVLSDFPGVPHRIEFVKELKKVKFYNDSKATNPDSAIKAIQALSSKSNNPDIILILGGLDKNVGLAPLIEEIKQHVKHVVLIGAAAVRFNKELIGRGVKNITFASQMQEAVSKAYTLAESGDQVLLSPACASFDMFSNFEERGEVFKSAARSLRE